MPTDVRQDLAEFIVQSILRTPERELRFDEPLLSRGLIDSLTLVDLALFVEDRFGVRLRNSELNAAAFDTISELANLISRRKKK
jgi:acyl carrier protein